MWVKIPGHSVEHGRHFLAALPPFPPLFIRTAQSNTTNVREARRPGLWLISVGEKKEAALINAYSMSGEQNPKQLGSYIVYISFLFLYLKFVVLFHNNRQDKDEDE